MEGSFALGSRGSFIGLRSGGQMVFQTGPDGNEYFAVLGGAANLVAAQRSLLNAQRTFERYGAEIQAIATRTVREEVQAAVAASGFATAEYAEKQAKSLLRRRIVRPTTPNARHLEDAIVARSLPVSSYDLGIVGIGDISRLDAHVNSRSGGAYWRAIEFGSEHLVGRTIRGFFQDAGGARYAPSPADFRAHPIFIPSQGPRMKVENPIKAKRFLSEAVFDAVTFRHRIWRDIEKAAVTEVAAIAAGTAPALRGARRGSVIPRSLRGYRPPP